MYERKRPRGGDDPFPRGKRGRGRGTWRGQGGNRYNQPLRNDDNPNFGQQLHDKPTDGMTDMDPGQHHQQQLQQRPLNPAEQQQQQFGEWEKEFVRYETSLPLSSYPDDELRQLTIYVIEFETALSVGTLHVPVEMAICSFSVDKGEIASFHKFIDPGNIPKCHLGSAIARRERHGLPIVKWESTEKSYFSLWHDLCSFLEYDEESVRKPPPPLYGKNPFLLNSCLHWLADKAGESNFFGAIRPVEELISSIYVRINKPLDSSTIHNFFLSYIMGDDKLYPCKYHAKLEVKGKLNCALANVRWLCHTCNTVMKRELQKKQQAQVQVSLMLSSLLGSGV